ncbi:GPO family capsid scaffolding protein [Novosphingobium sp. Leaf2]|uniref:GPO family capsid scaffolding protein n=1 Tax=Novosphingobium sp. Leaf2 TaxID=1735670 RepID=UPI0007013875|nr:GPO family capsid scaffolding protein [Novosphingobium sp. Leaf2]KQM21957.1 hypothetical protein ASE49_01190 [Novosphingobium sp. Leaf2]
MKTKPFLLATAGSTVDGRDIDDKFLKEMATSYDPKTYGARLNIEHIRGATGQAPFRAFGDVLELSTAEVDVNFNGKTEKRLGLYGVFDVTDEAKALNEGSQKVYPSIEIEPNFGGKGFAYLMGCALTDSPASIATERLQFNRQMPGTLHLSRDDAALIEFAESGGDAGDTFLTKLGTMIDSAFAKFTGGKVEDKPASKEDAKDPPAQAFDFNAFKALFTAHGEAITNEIGALRTELRTEVDALGVKFAKLEKEQEAAPDRNFRARPISDGGAAGYAGIF